MQSEVINKESHISIKFQTTSTNSLNSKSLECILNFYSDDKIADPKFNSKYKVESGSRMKQWETPCLVKSDCSTGGQIRNYNVSYSPLAYQLSKNKDFQNLLIENAIINVCSANQYEQNFDYEILEKSTFIIPKYEISLFKSHDNRNFIELTVWLPSIITGNSIDIETSSEALFISTIKPINYQLELKWPDKLVGDKDHYFASFLKKSQKLVMVSQLKNIPEEDVSCDNDVNKLQIKDSDLSNSSMLKTVEDNDDKFSNTKEETHQADSDFYETSSSNSNSPVSSMKQKNKRSSIRKVSFSDTNRCLIFHEQEPIGDMINNKENELPLKLQDGCSSRKYKNPTNTLKKKNKSKKSQSNNVGGCGKNKKKGRK